jgi:hypothetical protein
MTHHSYIAMVDKKELEKGHVIIKYNCSSDPTLVVGNIK